MFRFIEKRVNVFNRKTLKNMWNMSLNRSSSYATKPPEMQNTNESVAKDDVTHDKNKCVAIRPTMDREINLFGPQDIRAPLNGNIGLATNYVVNNQTIRDITEEIKCSIINEKIVDVDLMTIDPYFRQFRVLRDLSTNAVVTDANDGQLKSSPLLECVAHQCPLLLIRDFQDLFPNSNKPDLTHGLTVVTYCQKTSNDMSVWNKEVEVEREQLMDSFVTTAQNICNYLTKRGYWADFIDPSSGRPFLGEYTNATMFEVDERYRNFGFDIEDLGCCKVISHHVWGTHAFVGALFTSAPIDSQTLQNVLLNSDFSENQK